MNILIGAFWAALLMGSPIGGLSEEENRHLDNLVNNNIVFEYEEINSDNISDVVMASFIKVKIFHLFDKNCDSKTECGYVVHNVLKSKNTLIELTGPDVLLPFITPDFKLKSKIAANEFEEMLDVLFPTFFSSGQEIFQGDNKWFFIREESFGEKEGIVVTVDEEGTILNIEDGQAIERKDPHSEVEK